MSNKKFLKTSICLTSTMFLLTGSLPTVPVIIGHSDTLDYQEDSSGITGTTDGIIKKGQPQKTIPGNGQVYEIIPGLSVYGVNGSPIWNFTADDTVPVGTQVTIYVCGVGNTYVNYTLTINGAGTYVLDATAYGDFNQGLSLDIIPAPQEVTGNVVVHYVNEHGTPIAPDVELPTESWEEDFTPPVYNTAVGTYSTKTITFDNKQYQLDESLLPANAMGSYQAGQTIEVTYVYKEVPPVVKEVTGDVVVHYVDEQGTPIAPDATLPTESWAEGITPPVYNTVVGTYSTKTITFDNKQYQLDESLLPANAMGSYQAGQTIEVTYVYKEVPPVVKEVTGNVVVHYVDEQGTPIAPDATLPTESWAEGITPPVYNTVVGTYSTKTITFDNKQYQLDESHLPANAVGSYQAGQTIEVTYVYKVIPLAPETLVDSGIQDIPGQKKLPEVENISLLTSVKSSAQPSLVQEHKDLLPQTGTSKDIFLTFLGYALGVISLLSAFVMRKKHKGTHN